MRHLQYAFVLALPILGASLIHCVPGACDTSNEAPAPPPPPVRHEPVVSVRTQAFIASAEGVWSGHDEQGRAVQLSVCATEEVTQNESPDARYRRLTKADPDGTIIDLQASQRVSGCSGSEGLLQGGQGVEVRWLGVFVDGDGVSHNVGIFYRSLEKLYPSDGESLQLTISFAGSAGGISALLSSAGLTIESSPSGKLSLQRAGAECVPLAFEDARCREFIDDLCSRACDCGGSASSCGLSEAATNADAGAPTDGAAASDGGALRSRSFASMTECRDALRPSCTLAKNALLEYEGCSGQVARATCSGASISDTSSCRLW